MKRRTFIFGGLAAVTGIGAYALFRPVGFEEAVNDESSRQKFLDRIPTEYPLVYDPDLTKYRAEQQSYGSIDFIIRSDGSLVVERKPHDGRFSNGPVAATPINPLQIGSGRKSSVYISSDAFRNPDPQKSAEAGLPLFRSIILHEKRHCRDIEKGIAVAPGLSIDGKNAGYFAALGVLDDILELRGYATQIKKLKDETGMVVTTMVHTYLGHLGKIEQAIAAKPPERINNVDIAPTLRAIVQKHYTDPFFGRLIHKYTK